MASNTSKNSNPYERLRLSSDSSKGFSEAYRAIFNPTTKTETLKGKNLDTVPKRKTTRKHIKHAIASPKDSDASPHTVGRILEGLRITIYADRARGDPHYISSILTITSLEAENLNLR